MTNGPITACDRFLQQGCRADQAVEELAVTHHLAENNRLAEADPLFVANGLPQAEDDMFQIDVRRADRNAGTATNAGANDLGGTLMNESITRAAGAEFGQEFLPAEMRALIAAMHREPYQRTTLYGEASVERGATAMDAAPLTEVVNPPLQHRAKVKDRRLVRFGQA